MKTILLALALGSAMPARAQAPGAFPFVLPWDDASKAISDMRSLNHSPAGNCGFVGVSHGHLVTQKGRLRFLGVNICMDACFPSHDDAVKVAGRLAKFGVNCVRFHHMDGRPAPAGLLQGDMRTLDPVQLNRLDFFIAQLKRNGVYVDLNLHVSRQYPGAPQWPGMPGYFKGVDNFDPGLLSLQHDYARDLLTHLNPYTGKRYTGEPAVAFIEINNENSLVQEWGNGALDAMPDTYRRELARQWNAWLSARYHGAEALRTAWDAAPVPLGDEMLSGGPQSWSLEQHDVAKAERETGAFGPGGEQAARVRVTQPGSEGWLVQFNRAGLALAKGRPCTFTFWARSDAVRTIDVSAMQAHEPWNALWSEPLDLTSEWKQFSFVSRPSDSDKNARIGFGEMGKAVATFEFAGMSLRSGGVQTVLRDAAPGSVAWLPHRGFSALPAAVREDWISFLWDTESSYWSGMRRYIRDDLKAHALIIGSQVCNSPEPMQSAMDVVDNHAYWKHPSFPNKPWDSEDWTVENVPMAGATNAGTLASLAWRRAAGKPYVVTEYNHPAPNSYRAETLPLLCAYAALQDWDGVFTFDYCSDRTAYSSGRIGGFFSIGNDPVKMATLPAAAALFLRGDVAAAREQVLRTLDPVRSKAAIVSSAAYNAWSSPAGTDPLDALRHRCGWTPSPTSYTAPGVPESPREAVRSDTGELAWERATTVDTKRSKAVIGQLTREGVSLHGVTVAGEGNAVVALTAISGSAFTGPCDILVCAAADARNTGMLWKDGKRNSVGRNWGTAPTVVDGVKATITLPLAARNVRAWVLDERGARGRELTVSDEGGKASVGIGPEIRALWYEIVVK